MKIQFERNYAQCCKKQFILVEKEVVSKQEERHRVLCKHCKYEFEVFIEKINEDPPPPIEELAVHIDEEIFVSKIEAVFEYSNQKKPDMGHELYRDWARVAWWNRSKALSW